MIPFLLGIGIPMAILGSIIYLNVQSEKHVADIELLPLPESVKAYVPVGSAILQLVSYALLALVCIAVTFPFGLRLLKGVPINLMEDPRIPLLGVIGALLLFFAMLGIFHGLINLVSNTSLNSSASPIVEMNETDLVVKGHRFPWTAMSGFQPYTVSGSKGSLYIYLVLSFVEQTPLGSVGLTGSSFSSWLFKLHRMQIRKILNLPQGRNILVPLYALNRQQSDLSIFAQRYWGQATNHPYKPQSIEAYYPQKSSRDFEQK